MVDVYQPGSTFKILTVASGLATGAIKPNYSMYDSGTLAVGNRSVHNHDGGHGQIDLLHLFIHSSNVGAASVALKMTPQQFHDKLYDFSIGRLTGVDLPGESAGLLLNAKTLAATRFSLYWVRSGRHGLHSDTAGIGSFRCGK